MIEELISFKGAQYPKSVTLYAVYFYVRFPVSYRDREEIMAERGIDLDHATLNRWGEKYAGAIFEEAHRRKTPTGHTCTEQSINRGTPLISCCLNAATTVLMKTIGNNGWPDKVVIPFRDIAAQCTVGQWTKLDRIRRLCST
ncbi:putative transposase [Sulfitobacter undariae]|uniref:Putative transposase n=1 Tax=Sulfitobacter undariae TaxID=1563671 RepID=A0A7W6ED60_9RHOB|nr:putative transposase [Sulfitobacter undariae]